MVVFGTILIIVGAGILGWNKKLKDSTKIGWFIFSAVLVILYILKHVFS